MRKLITSRGDFSARARVICWRHRRRHDASRIVTTRGCQFWVAAVRRWQAKTLLYWL